MWTVVFGPKVEFPLSNVDTKIRPLVLSRRWPYYVWLFLSLGLFLRERSEMCQPMLYWILNGILDLKKWCYMVMNN